jgi:hypothetical protein
MISAFLSEARKKISVVTWPTLFGTELKLYEEVKHLGVTLDPKLTFSRHLENRIKKATT